MDPNSTPAGRRPASPTGGIRLRIGVVSAIGSVSEAVKACVVRQDGVLFEFVIAQHRQRRRFSRVSHPSTHQRTPRSWGARRCARAPRPHTRSL